MHKSRSAVNAFQVRVLAAAVASCFASAALANPTGGVPVQGTVSMDAPALGQLHITNSPNSIIHWNSFSIGAGELTKFIQESASSAVLNRVVAPGSLSEILGTLQSNGRVFLINPNGITIGAGAVLDLPGFVASSLDMTDADFTAGRMRFQQAPSVAAGTVTNQASVFMPDGGQVYLIGGSVVNEPGGFINSPNGEVVLAAGHSVELMSAGAPGVSVAIAAPENEAVNLGQIFAGVGSVGIFGGVINQGGVVSANDAFFGPGGTIQLRATGATTLAAGSITSAGDLQIDTGSLAVAGLADSRTQSIRASGGVVVENAPGGFAQLSAQSGQSIEAGFVEVNAVAGGNASIFSFGGAQSIETSGANGVGESVVVRAHDGGFAGITGFGGPQSIALTGDGPNALVVGGSASPGFSLINAEQQSIVAGSITVQGPAQIRTNPLPGATQTISTSGGIEVRGGAAPSGAAAGIFHNGSGMQSITAQGIFIQGGADGMNNGALIGANGGAQSVQAGTITLVGGADGTGNTAILRSGPGLQTIVADQIDVTGGAGGTGNFAVIVSPRQHVTVHGDLTLSGGGSLPATFGGGALLGGGSTAPTDLTLNVGGDVTLNGGSVPVAGAGIGAGSAGGQRTDIAMNVGGDVTLNPGSATGTRIGSPSSNVAGGEISVTAGGTIALNSAGPGNAGSIHTADGVHLTAGRIVQGPDSRIEASSLGVQTQRGASLTGANVVSALSLSNMFSGDVAFNNASDQLIVTQALNIPGALSLQQTGDMLVTGHISSGPQTINVSGGLRVENAPFSFAQIGATNGQTIDAGYVEVIGNAGASASIFNFGGEQRIRTSSANTAGEGIAVRAFDGGFATIDSPSGPQTIEVRNADRAVIDAAQGFALVGNFEGTQVFSLSGAGSNALVLGSPDSLGQSVIGGGAFQTVIAGNPGEEGSITLHGAAGGGFGNTLIVSNPVLGGTQTISTPGAISVLGGASPASPGAAGIFANGIGGHQTVIAGSILLQAGSAGSGNTAMVGANSGSQTIDVGAGGITLRGGETGGNNFAMINQASTDPAATQTIASAGPVLLEGGSGGFNFAMIRAFGGHQTFEAGDTTLLAGAGGIDNFSTIQGRVQDVTVHGDLAIVARGSGGSPTVGGGARIGGLGGAAPSATNLALDVGGNLTMTAGSVSGTGVSLGGNIVDDLPSNVAATVGGNVTLNGGTAPDTFARVGSANSGATGGSIDITAGGAIALNSSAPDQASIIRTTDDVALTAQQITQGPDARIEAESLTTHTTAGASLGGANSVNELAMLNSASGEVAFNNTSALLTVTGIDQVPHGALALSQDGDLLVSGDVTSGAQTIAASGDMTIAAGDGPGITVRAYGPQTFNVGGTFSLLGGSAWDGYAQTLASGPVSITTGNDLLVRAGGGLLAYALLYGSDGLHLTVGDALRIDGGSGPFAFARVQTDFWDRIYLTFPNRASGGYFVNGREGVTRSGLDGFFTGLRPAIRNRSLVVSYGE